jgi:lysophospholipase L1-like esterase
MHGYWRNGRGSTRPAGRGAAVVATAAMFGGLTIIASGMPAAASTARVSYVALGDSYTAAPLVLPLAPGAPLECLQSSNNYPHLTAASFHFSLTDRSCSSATTANLTTAQYLDQPPQFDALTATTSAVTIGIGGNDNQLFLSAVLACSATDGLDVLNAGAPCQSVFGSYFENLATGDGPTVGQALATLHVRAPAAKVFVVGYPDILPQRGNCYPQLPITTGDIAYLNKLETTLNAMLQREAAAHGATYVDTYTASVGHDACTPEGLRWVEPVLPGTVAFPVHPNASGEAADARAVQAALRAAGFS